MKIFYDANGKRISRGTIKDMMTKEATTAGPGLKCDKEINAEVIKNMSVEDFAKMKGIKCKDTNQEKR